MIDLNLRRRIRAILADTGEADPGVIAEKIVADLNSRELRPALLESMRTLVREVIRYERSDVPAEQPAPGNGRSRARAVAEAWKAHLRDRVFVGEWRLLGECSPDEVLFLASDRRHQAEQLTAAADRYEALHAAMTEHGAVRVAELPEAVLRDALGDAA